MLLPEDHRLEGSAPEIEHKLQRLASIGRPLPDVEVRIVDLEGAEVAPGEIGEIAVRTPPLMKG
jgi:acyl-CoA synthetase (AMP-forming)/AMP-acid ligase II